MYFKNTGVLFSLILGKVADVYSGFLLKVKFDIIENYKFKICN